MIDQSEESSLQPSKTSRKKEMHALQEVGVQLTRLNDKQLLAMQLSERLLGAVREYRRLPNSHGAQRRQLQFIGRLMRDYDLAEIKGRLDILLQPHQTVQRKKRRLAELCDQVFNLGEAGVDALVTEYAALERQSLRQYLLEYHRALENEDEPGIIRVRERLSNHFKAQLDDLDMPA